jgi:ankyrin repeat protein
MVAVELALLTSLAACSGDVSSDPFEMLLDAVNRGDTETVKTLIAQGADVNATADFGRTALIEAATEGHTDIVQLLKQAGSKE